MKEPEMVFEQNNNQEERLAQFENLCREKGLRITPQRIAVFKALLESKSHPTAEEIYRQVKEQMSSISLDTVNRTLNTLLQIGAAFLVEGTGQPKRYDGGKEIHHHFRCLDCGAVIDFDYDRQIEIPPHLAENLTILRKSVYLEGFCKQCSEKRKQQSEERRT